MKRSNTASLLAAFCLLLAKNALATSRAYGGSAYPYPICQLPAPYATYNLESSISTTGEFTACVELTRLQASNQIQAFDLSALQLVVSDKCYGAVKSISLDGKQYTPVLTKYMPEQNIGVKFDGYEYGPLPTYAELYDKPVKICITLKFPCANADSLYNIITYFSKEQGKCATTSLWNGNYQVQPSPVYAEPSPVYSEPSPVYSEPSPVYSEPSPVYAKPSPVYAKPSPVYHAKPSPCYKAKPSPVYAKPSPVYAKPSPVYVKPSPVYAKPSPVYVEPSPVYAKPSPVYVEPSPVYSKPSPVYVEPSPVYSKPSPVYVEPSPVYAKPSPVYVEPSPVYSKPSPVYVEPSPVYSKPSPVYVEPSPVYAKPSPVYQAKPSPCYKAKPSPVYAKPSPVYHAKPSPVYAEPSPVYAKPSPVYGQPSSYPVCQLPAAYKTDNLGYTISKSGDFTACVDLKGVQATNQIQAFDLSALQLVVSDKCYGAVKSVTLGNKQYTPVLTKYTNEKNVGVKIVGSLPTYAELYKAPVKVCITLKFPCANADSLYNIVTYFTGSDYTQCSTDSLFNYKPQW